MNTHSPVPNDSSAAQARGVLTDPDICASNHALRVTAWLVLKSQRGQTVRQIKLQDLRHG